MNAVEIEEAVSCLADEPFDPAEFPYEVPEAFWNKETTLKRLRAEGKASTSQPDLPGGLLQRNNIHLAVCEVDFEKTVRLVQNHPAGCEGSEILIRRGGRRDSTQELRCQEPNELIFRIFKESSIRLSG